MSLITNSAVIDTCLLINWAEFEFRDLLKELFSILYMPEKTFAEVKSQKTVKLAAEWLAERYLILVPVTEEDERKVTHLMSLRAKFPHLPILDAPEAYALVLAEKFGCPLLTDNKAPRLLVELTVAKKDMTVLDSLELLTKIPLPPNFSSRYELVELFMNQTSFQFSKKRLRAIFDAD